MRAKDAKTSKRVCLVRDGRVPQQDTRKRGSLTVAGAQARKPTHAPPTLSEEPDVGPATRVCEISPPVLASAWA